MNRLERSQHWENVYQTKSPEECSWYQKVPDLSISLIEQASKTVESQIIDMGGGQSFIVDRLLSKGYQNISVLDISKTALNKAQERLRNTNAKVNWIEGDAADLSLPTNYDVWHDRATFHFLTEKPDIQRYVSAANRHINKNGYLIVGTFSKQGPKKCSGLSITQYSAESLEKCFSEFFQLEKTIEVDHKTPFESIQHFIFGIFKKTQHS